MSARLASARPPLDPSPFGMGIYQSDRVAPEDLVRAAELARDAGIRWSRDAIGWGTVQSARGEWSFAHCDRAVDTMLAHGISTMGYFSYSVPWAATRKTEDGTPHWCSPPDPVLWREYILGTVEHFRDRIGAWQIWNEPNHPNFWYPKPDPREYARLLIESARAVKEADPTALVVGCNLSMVDLRFARTVFEEGGWDACDVIGVHPYRCPHTPERTDLSGDLLDLASLSAEFGYVKTMWMTEYGYPTHTGGSSEWWAAIMLVRSYLIAWSTGLVQKIMWYDWRDDGDDRDYNEHNFGIIHRDWTPKKGWEAYRTMTQALAGCTPEGRAEIGADVVSLRFRAPDGTARSVVWTTGENERHPVPAPAECVRVVRTWSPEKTVRATNGWAMLDLDAVPTFLIPA